MGKKQRYFSLILMGYLTVSGADVGAFADYYPADNFFSEYSYSPPSYGRQSTGNRPGLSFDFNHQSILNNAARVAAREGRVADLEGLIAQGAEVDSMNDSGMTPLMYAARNCSSKMADLLLKKKADVNAVDHAGRTPLMFATREQCPQVVELLVKVPGIKYALRDKSLRTAMDYAEDEDMQGVDERVKKMIGLMLFSRKTN